MTHTIKDTVYLRKRPRRNGVFALYLDICRKGKRSNEYLKLYLIPENTREDRQKNRETMRLAEALRAKRVVELQSRDFGLNTTAHEEARFYDVVRGIIERKEGTTRAGWENCLAHLLRYEPDQRITFGEITPQWVRGFRDYLDSRAMQWGIDRRKGRDSRNHISQGTKALMFQKLCAVFNTAMKEGIISINPTAGVERFRMPETNREFLTVEEVRRLRDTPAPNEELARAFFFSCLTGLRWSDIAKLKWKEVQEWNTGTRIVFTQKKTGGLEYLDLNAQAASILGERGEPEEAVFSGLYTVQAARVLLGRWTKAAGIDKHITFHCARHTFAVMMLDLGVDLYTVSKLLGHRSIATTQVYAKILDKNKKAAVDRIPKIF